MEKEELVQLFRRNSDCYADTHDIDPEGKVIEGEVIMAMTEEAFLKAINEYHELRKAQDKIPIIHGPCC